MTLKLYDWPWSPFCLKVRAILDYKQLTYERIPIMGGGGRHLRIVRRKGAGKVPALDVDGRLVIDSTNIAEELERLAPEPAILPLNPRDRALCHAIEEWADESLYFLGLHYQWREAEGARIAAKAFRTSLIGAVTHLFLRRRIERQVVAQGTGRKSAEHIESDLRRHLDAVAALVVPGPFVLGDRPTLADFALMGQLVYLSRTPRGGVIVGEQAVVGAYLERMKALRGGAA